MQSRKTIAKIVAFISCKFAGLVPAEHGINPTGNTSGVKLLSAPVLLLILTVGVSAHNTFVYTNDDVPAGNTVFGFSVAQNGVLTPIPGSPFPTGGSGVRAGAFAANRVRVSSTARLLYAGNTGSQDVSGFSIDPLTGFLTTVTGSPFPSLLQAIPVATRGNAPRFQLPLVLTNDLIRNLRRPRPVADLGAYRLFENTAASNYNSLQLEARKRFSSGYNFTAAYTWSHAIDDVSDIFPMAGAPVLAQDQSSLRPDRGNASFDVRQRLALSFIWDLPFYRNGSRNEARWLGGWQLSSIFQYGTGQPFTLTLPLDANLDGNLTDRPPTTGGLLFSSGHSRQRVSIAPGHTLADFFVLGRDGLVGRNTVRRNTFIDWDLAIAKVFRFNERQGLDFRTEAFNLMNRANFGLPIRVLSAPGFGRRSKL